MSKAHDACEIKLDISDGINLTSSRFSPSQNHLIVTESTMFIRALAFAIAAAALVFVSPLAHSQSVLQLQNGATIVTIGDNSANDSNGSTGVITYMGAVGNFNTNITTGSSKPAVGGATTPELDLTSLNITNDTDSPQTLTLLFSDNNFGPVTGTPQASLSITQLGQSPSGPANGSVSYRGYFDSANMTLAQTTLLTSIGPITTTGNGSNSGSLGTFANPFALTQAVTITLNAGGTFLGSANLDIVPVPEVNTVLAGVLATIVIGVSFARRRLSKFFAARLSA